MKDRKTEGESRKVPVKKLAVVLAAVAVVYLAGVYYFSSHFLPGTELSGVGVGGKTADSAKSAMVEHWLSYTLALELRDGKSEKIEASEIGMDIEFGDNVNQAQKEQNPFLWPIHVFVGREMEIEGAISYDETLMEQEIDGLTCMKKADMVKPVNAKIQLKNGEFVVEEEILGTTIKKKEFVEAVKTAILAGQDTLNLEEAGCYKNPTIYAEDEVVSQAKKRIEELRAVVVTYDFEYTTETVDKNLIDQWIVVDKKMQVSLDYEKVLDYIEELAAKYDTYATVRDFTNSYGKDIQILFGAYGWKISQTKETRALMEVIENGQSGTREPIYMYRAQCRKEGNIDWDDTYAEVSISGQHMWFYKDGECVVSTDIVTGDVVRPGRKTPTGAYALLYKLKDQVLVGEDYESGVKYWMPFDTNVGFHDASWRKAEEFGGDTYKGNGSHGCVNMPEGAAAKLYQYIEKGCPVFVY